MGGAYSRGMSRRNTSASFPFLLTFVGRIIYIALTVIALKSLHDSSMNIISALLFLKIDVE